MQAGITQKDYVHQDGTYPQNQLHQKKIHKSSHYPQKNRVLIIISLIRWRGISSPLNTLLFLSRQIARKIACGINRMLLSLTFIPKAPSQAKRWFLTEFETTQETPKQLKGNSHRTLANWQYKSSWSGDSKSSLHIEHLFTKIIPFFCKLSRQNTLIWSFPHKNWHLQWT